MLWAVLLHSRLFGNFIFKGCTAKYFCCKGKLWKCYSLHRTNLFHFMAVSVSIYFMITRGRIAVDVFCSRAALFLRSGRPCQLEAKPVKADGWNRCWVSALWLVARSHGASGRWSAVWHARPLSKKSPTSPRLQTLQLCTAKSWCWDIHWRMAAWVIHSPICATLL